MAGTALEISMCDICGADVRVGSAFCYNCGGSVAEADSEALPESEVGNIDANAAEVAPALSNGNSEATDTAASKPAAPYDPQKRRNERTASRRRGITKLEAKSKVIEWQPATGLSTGFIVGFTLLVIFAFAVIILAFYFR